MVFTPINVVQGTTPVNATWGNNAQTQYTESILSFGPDLFSPFILTGLVCSADGTTLNQLDVTAGTAYLAQTDGTTRQRKTAASVANQFLTSVINTTYYLFLNNDGTFTFGTNSTPPANSLAICQATTNASGNISGVTDKRSLTVAVFPGSGAGISGITQIQGALQLGGSTGTAILFPKQGHIEIQTNWEFRGSVTPPSTGPATAVVAGTALGVGAYSYKVTFGTDDGETAAGPTAAATTTTNNQAVNLSAIPTSTDAKVFKRSIYRTKVGGSAYFLLTVIVDNTTTTYSDTVADTSLGAAYNPRQTAGGSTLWFNSGFSITAWISGATGQVFFDAGAVTSDGAGNVGVTSLNFSGGPSGSQGKIDFESPFMVYRPPESGATPFLHVFQVWDGAAATNALQIGGTPGQIGATTIDKLGNFSNVAGISTGGRGVPIFVQRIIDQAVTNTTNVVVASINVPAAHTPVRVWCTFVTNGTNNGIITLKVTYTDANNQAATTQFLTLYGATETVLNGATVAKSSAFYQTEEIVIECQNSTNIALQYQNTAAGTIVDFVSGGFEYL